MGNIWWLILSLCTKFQNNSFIRSIVSNKNVKITFLSPEPRPDDFSKILFYGDMINNGTCLCIKFHSHRPSSFWGVESQRNHRSGGIRVLLTTLAPLNEIYLFILSTSDYRHKSFYTVHNQHNNFSYFTWTFFTAMFS